jgi:hypothetical protein
MYGPLPPVAKCKSTADFDFTCASINRPCLHESLDLSVGQAEQITENILIVLAEERGGATNAAGRAAQAPGDAV